MVCSTEAPFLGQCTHPRLLKACRKVPASCGTLLLPKWYPWRGCQLPTTGWFGDTQVPPKPRLGTTQKAIPVPELPTKAASPLPNPTALLPHPWNPSAPTLGLSVLPGHPVKGRQLSKERKLCLHLFWESYRHMSYQKSHEGKCSLWKKLLVIQFKNYKIFIITFWTPTQRNQQGQEVSDAQGFHRLTSQGGETSPGEGLTHHNSMWLEKLTPTHRAPYPEFSALTIRAAIFNPCSTVIFKTCNTWLFSQGHWPFSLRLSNIYIYIKYTYMDYI